MFAKKHFTRLMNLFLCFFLSIAMGSVILIYTHEFSFPELVLSFVSGMTISYFICDLIPVGDLGAKFSKALHLKENGLGFTLVSTLVITFIMITLTSFFCTFVTLGYKPVLFPVWISVYPYWMLVGYICLLILIPLAIRFAEALTAD